MLIIQPKTLLKQVREVRILAPAGELGCIAKANIDHPLDAGSPKRANELLERFLCKPDSVDNRHNRRLRIDWAVRARIPRRRKRRRLRNALCAQQEFAGAPTCG